LVEASEEAFVETDEVVLLTPQFPKQRVSSPGFLTLPCILIVCNIIAIPLPSYIVLLRFLY
jgi:hypothetical protein